MKMLFGFLAAALLLLSAPVLASPSSDPSTHATITAPDSTAAPLAEPSATVIVEQPCEVRQERAVAGQLRVALATCEVRAASEPARDKPAVDTPNPYASFVRFNPADRGRARSRVLRC
jgi:hypothetical protein